MKLILPLIILINICLLAEEPLKNYGSSAKKSVYSNIDLSKVKDTIFTLSDHFVEIDLSKQKAYLHSRKNPIKEFLVSTGTKRIKDGVETKTGLFVIQHKAAKWYSVQFDSTVMLNWMGFNFGIGFHALLGNSYYKYLGVKPSSHGCVRISREDGKDLFPKLNYGTPILVHKGDYAVTIGFADKNSAKFSYYSVSELSKVISKRLQKLYDGNFLIEVKEKILIDQGNVSHSGLPIGDVSRINPRQRINPDYLFVDLATPNEIRAELIPFNSKQPPEYLSEVKQYPALLSFLSNEQQ